VVGNRGGGGGGEAQSAFYVSIFVLGCVRVSCVSLLIFLSFGNNRERRQVKCGSVAWVGDTFRATYRLLPTFETHLWLSGQIASWVIRPPPNTGR